MENYQKLSYKYCTSFYLCERLAETTKNERKGRIIGFGPHWRSWGLSGFAILISKNPVSFIIVTRHLNNSISCFSHYHWIIVGLGQIVSSSQITRTLDRSSSGLRLSSSTLTCLIICNLDWSQQKGFFTPSLRKMISLLVNAALNCNSATPLKMMFLPSTYKYNEHKKGMHVKNKSRLSFV